MRQISILDGIDAGKELTVDDDTLYVLSVKKNENGSLEPVHYEEVAPNLFAVSSYSFK